MRWRWGHPDEKDDPIGRFVLHAVGLSRACNHGLARPGILALVPDMKARLTLQNDIDLGRGLMGGALPTDL